jgi:hypothetical protein
VSVAGGCGATLDDPVGFCDPRWSGCVGPTGSNSSCTDYCKSIGKTCKEGCITSRGYPNRGAEAWQTGAGCVDPAAMGAGQTDCAFSWDLTEARWRCCCL